MHISATALNPGFPFPDFVSQLWRKGFFSPKLWDKIWNRKSGFKAISIIPWSHCVPLHPVGQVQYPGEAHCPPFWQGGSHTAESGKRTVCSLTDPSLIPRPTCFLLPVVHALGEPGNKATSTPWFWSYWHKHGISESMGLVRGRGGGNSVTLQSFLYVIVWLLRLQSLVSAYKCLLQNHWLLHVQSQLSRTSLSASSPWHWSTLTAK